MTYSSFGPHPASAPRYSTMSAAAQTAAILILFMETFPSPIVDLPWAIIPAEAPFDKQKKAPDQAGAT